MLRSKALQTLRAVSACSGFNSNYFPVLLTSTSHSIQSLLSTPLSTDAPPQGPEISALLEGLQAVSFHPRLDSLKQHFPVMDWNKLIKECEDSSEEISPAEAERICFALHTAGIILKHGNIVYMRPDEVAVAIQRVLPQQSNLLQQQLTLLNGKLLALDMQKANIKRRAAIRGKLFAWLGFGVLASQWGLLFRLTYWELSWDVMEPIGFFVGGFTTLLTYLYYIQTSRDFSYSDAHERFMSSWERKAFDRSGFDIQGYKALKLEAERYAAMLRLQSGGYGGKDGSGGGGK
jgi:hypothetical protein